MKKFNKNYFYIYDFCNFPIFTFINKLCNNKLWIEKKFDYKFKMILLLIIISLKLFSKIFILFFILKFSLPRLSENLFLKLII